MNWTRHLFLAFVALTATLPTWAQTLDVKPEVIPFSDPEIVNPMRGFYSRWGKEWAPVQTFDVYERSALLWRAFEPAKDEYDFSLISKAAAKAKDQGRKLGFRVMSYNPDHGGSNLPDYISDDPAIYGQGTWKKAKANGEDPNFIPDWNNNNFLTRAEALIARMGQTFDGDPRIGFVDIGIYGRWGEWNMAKGDPTIGLEGGARIIDAYVAAFPNKWLVIRQGGRFHQYALDKSEKIGIRCDRIGDPAQYTEITTNRGYTPEGIQKALNRWKTAPTITEFRGHTPATESKYDVMALDQIHKSHIAMINNDVRGSWASTNSEVQKMFLDLGKSAGYRFNLTRVTAEPTAGNLAIASQWTNTGVTPCYEKFDVTWQLRDAAGNVAFSGISKLDLTKFLPTEKEPPTKVEDVFALPSGLAPGTYQLHMVILDPTQYRKPLLPAIKGIAEDGSYKVGPITIIAATPARP